MGMVRFWVCSALSVLLTSAALAQDVYPSRTVKLVVGAAPGGNPDILGRMLAQRLTETLSKPFVVENIPGAGGVLGAVAVAKAAPDGYVLMLGDSGALAINVALQPGLSYDPLKSFTPITALATVPTILVGNINAVPAEQLGDLLAMLRREPGKFSYGSAGQGSIHHLTMALFADRAGVELLHVPYRAGSAMVAGLMSGEVHLGWSGIPNILPLITTGKLRSYCISIPERSKSVPNVPTCDELGQKGFNAASMIGLQAPAGVPENVVTLMQASVAKLLREPAIADRMNELGMVMQEKGTAHYVQYMKDDLQLYADAVQRLKISVK